MCQNQNIGTLGLWKIKRVKIHFQSSTKKTEVAQTASVFVLYGIWVARASPITSGYKTKTTAKLLSFIVLEWKTRLEPALRACRFSRIVLYTPSPWKGSFRVARANLATREYKTKKDSVKLSSSFWSGKREFNLCSPIILSAKILRFFRFTFEFRSNSLGGCREGNIRSLHYH